MLSDPTPEIETDAESELEQPTEDATAEVKEFSAELDLHVEEEPAAPIAEEVTESPVAKRPRKAPRKSPRKKGAAIARAEVANDPESATVDPFAMDLRTTSAFHTDEDFTVVVNPNPYPVTANFQGQILPGYSRGVVSTNDPVSRRAIEKGILLVPSGQ